MEHFCVKCGNKLNDNALFCSKCGARVQDNKNGSETESLSGLDMAANSIANGSLLFTRGFMVILMGGASVACGFASLA